MNRTRPSVPVLAVAAVVVLVSITGGTAKTTQKTGTAAPVVIIKQTSLGKPLVARNVNRRPRLRGPGRP